MVVVMIIMILSCIIGNINAYQSDVCMEIIIKVFSLFQISSMIQKKQMSLIWKLISLVGFDIHMDICHMYMWKPCLGHLHKIMNHPLTIHEFVIRINILNNIMAHCV